MCRSSFLMLGAALLVRSVLLFWNLENAFDPYDDPLTRDEEFTPGGAKHWTWKRMDRKLIGVAKTILVAADTYGEPPVLIGLCEVENALVVKRLAEKTPLSAYDYGWVHRDSPDARGIDVALLFRRDAFRVLRVEALPVATAPPTRDILYVKGVLRQDTVHLFVNHWPSKLGGAEGRSRREAAAEALRACVDSIDAAPRPPGAPAPTLILCGDFNATPAEIDLPVPGLVNVAAPLATAGEGSIKYRGTWELIDQFFVRIGPDSTSIGTPGPSPRMEVFRPPFLLEPDGSYTGEKPRRTWSGPHYKGGLSDHLPVVLLL